MADILDEEQTEKPIEKPEESAAPETATEADNGGDNNGNNNNGGGGNGSSGSVPPEFDVSPIAIEEEMRTSYLDYAMSVIVSRALPDVCDGLKPVHRRILFSMNENGYEFNKPYRKSARVVGDVIGKYHPHGDQSIYDALVRMAQDFSMRLPLLDGQGNFGSVDGDPAAAMRYTEVRMAKPAHALLEDIDKDTVDFQDNYDNSEREPTVLPARFPNLLVNGANGIAVGMATNIPPHNLGEISNAVLKLIENPDTTEEEICAIVPGPDFPTGGQILGRQGVRAAAMTGRGSIIMRGTAEFVQIRKDRQAIIITAIPYQVNKTSMIEKIAELVREKTIEGISDIRDESDRDGMRIVIELKRDAVGEVVLNQLYRYSMLQTSFGANMLALNSGRPELMNLRAMLQAFIAFRERIVTRRAKFNLNKARAGAHILVGLAIAIANIDEIITLIRKAPSPQEARTQLMTRAWGAENVSELIQLIDDPRHRIAENGTIHLSEEQARAILELRLQRLTAIGRDEIGGELKTLGEEITDLLDILRSRQRVMDIISTETKQVRDEFATPRMTEILDTELAVDDEDLIPQEDMVVTVSHAGYIKRVPLSTYRAQRRGGKGRTGMSTKEEDFVTRIFAANTPQLVLFFSTTAIVSQMKVWKFAAGRPLARGSALVNLLPLQTGETINAIMALPTDENSWGNYHVMFATSRGNVRRNDLSDFININKGGKIAMKPDEGEQIIGVALCTESDDIVLTSNAGRCIRFPVTNVRVFRSRSSTGVRGIRLNEGNEIISMAILRHSEATAAERYAYLKEVALRRRADDEASENGASEVDDELNGETEADEEIKLTPERYEEMRAQEQFLLTISQNGYGKRTSAYEYRTTARGGKGLTAMTVTERNGPLVASFPVTDSDQIMLVTDGGQLIRCPVEDLRIIGRNTQGVTIFRTDENARVVSVICLQEESPETENTANKQQDRQQDRQQAKQPAT